MALTGDERRLIETREPAPAGPPARPAPGQARPVAPAPVGARARRAARRRAGAGRHSPRPMSPAAFDVKHRSRALTEGPARAAARAYLHGIGYSAEDLAKPIVGVAHSWIETMPCNFNNRVLAAKVKEGIRAAGGTPMELNTIAISDGITMGTVRDARLARLARADRRLDRAGRERPPLRRARRHQRLRQDDPRHRDGARAARHPGADALRRLDPARPLQGRGGDDPAGLRGGRRARGRQDRATRSCTSWRRPPRPAPARAAASSPRTRWRWRSRCSASRPPARRWCRPRTAGSSTSRSSAASS